MGQNNFGRRQDRLPYSTLYPEFLNPTPFDSAYVIRLRDGDADTELHFISHFSSVIRLSLRTRLRSWELIEDIRRETLQRVINFIRSDRSQDHPERLGAYVHSVSINAMMEHLRASTRHPPIPEAAHPFPGSRTSADRAVVSGERKGWVKTILAELSEKDRLILRAIFLEEKEKSAICEEFQVDRDYLRLVIHRATTCFRDAIDKSGMDSQG